MFLISVVLNVETHFTRIGSRDTCRFGASKLSGHCEVEGGIPGAFLHVSHLMEIEDAVNCGTVINGGRIHREQRRSEGNDLGAKADKGVGLPAKGDKGAH